MERSKNSKRVLILVAVLLVALAVAAVASQGGSVLVSGNSMQPTYQNGDRVIFMNLFYIPQNGDVVILDIDGFEDTFIKRVIGVAGDELEFDEKTGLISRNGNILEITEKDGLLYEGEYTILSRTADWKDAQQTVIVPQGYVFVLGDNRGNSRDSRNEEVGMIHTSRIEGKAIFTIN